MNSSAQARPIPTTIRNPKAVMKDATLSSSAKVLYQNLVNDADECGTVDMYMYELARDLGVTENRAGLLVRELRDANLIQTRQQGRRPLSFTLLAIAAAFIVSAPASPASAQQLTLGVETNARGGSLNLGISVTGKKAKTPSGGAGAPTGCGR